MNGLLPCQRHLFDIPDDVAYLNCSFVSPLMNNVRDAGQHGVTRKAHPWLLKPEHFFSEVEVVRALFAELIAARSDDVAIVPSVTYGMAVAAANIEVAAGDGIVVLEHEFPSNVLPWMELQKTRGARIVTVPQPSDGDWTSAVLDVIDERVAIAALSHAHWIYGDVIDLVKVGMRCREVGAALVLDMAQSLGVLPFSVHEVQPDFLIAPTYKFLLGPYSLAFLYAKPTYHAGHPIEQNWFNRASSSDFATLTAYREEFEPGARRFDVGERANFALVPMAIAALQQIHEWTVPRIASTLAALIDRASEHVKGLGFDVGPTHRAHIMSIRVPAEQSEHLSRSFLMSNVFVSFRGDAIRIAPHVYNNDRDIDRLVSALKLK